MDTHLDVKEVVRGFVWGRFEFPGRRRHGARDVAVSAPSADGLDESHKYHFGVLRFRRIITVSFSKKINKNSNETVSPGLAKLEGNSL